MKELDKYREAIRTVRRSVS